MIRGMAIAARALAREELADSAARALSFIRSTLWREGRLVATYMAGKAHLNAYLDDYAYLIDAMLELQQVRVRADELDFARQLLEVVLTHFEDQAGGGFYFTSDDHEVLIHRMKPFSDDAIPAGNGIAASVLLRFGHLLGEPRYLAAAERVLAAAWPVMSRHPQGHATLLTALEELLHPPQIVLIRGEAGGGGELAARTGAAVCAAAHRAWHPGGCDPACPPRWPTSPPVTGSTLAYVCRGSTCSAPLDSLAALTGELRARALGEQLDVAADGGGVDGERALGGKAQQVVRAAGLGSGAGEALATEGLHAHHRTDHVAVDVGVTHRQARGRRAAPRSPGGCARPRVSPKPVRRIAASTCGSSPLR